MLHICRLGLKRRAVRFVYIKGIIDSLIHLHGGRLNTPIARVRYGRKHVPYIEKKLIPASSASALDAPTVA